MRGNLIKERWGWWFLWGIKSPWLLWSIAACHLMNAKTYFGHTTSQQIFKSAAPRVGRYSKLYQSWEINYLCCCWLMMMKVHERVEEEEANETNDRPQIHRESTVTTASWWVFLVPSSSSSNDLWLLLIERAVVLHFPCKRGIYGKCNEL